MNMFGILHKTMMLIGHHRQKPTNCPLLSITYSHVHTWPVLNIHGPSYVYIYIYVLYTTYIILPSYPRIVQSYPSLIPVSQLPNTTTIIIIPILLSRAYYYPTLIPYHYPFYIISVYLFFYMIIMCIYIYIYIYTTHIIHPLLSHDCIIGWI